MKQSTLDTITNYCELEPIVCIGIFKIPLARTIDELTRWHVDDRSIFLKRTELNHKRLMINRVMACDLVMSDNSKEVMPLSIRSMMGMTCRLFTSPINMTDITREAVMNACMIERSIAPNVH
jgi:hypothetical protein